MPPKSSSSKTKPKPKPPEPVKEEHPTIASLHLSQYHASRPYLTLAEKKGFASLTATEKTGYTYSVFLLTEVWRTWSAPQQKEFWDTVKELKIPFPQKKVKQLGKDSKVRELGSYSVEEYRQWERREKELRGLREKSESFREKYVKWKSEGKEEEEEFEGEIEEEKNRRKLIGHLSGKRMARYEGDPEWDDVVPIPQDDGEGALAAIAYTDEYAEAMSYLRAIMASKEHSPRVLTLTEHIISLNPAHYTVWLYRASTIFALNSSIPDELEWVNETALENQKNYQIWHHRQLLIDYLYAEIEKEEEGSREEKIKALAKSEVEFMGKMFDEDAKNYHVWSYRQYLVRKLNMWGASEIQNLQALITRDVRNNSAWSHRFFVVFSDPSYSTPDSKATEPDHQIPRDIVEREVAFVKEKVALAPQNQSPWNYLRGVLRKGDRELAAMVEWVEEYAKIKDEKGEVLGFGEEQVKSSHALDFLADAWAENGGEKEKVWADKALELLGSRYDAIRKGYWEWRRGLSKAGSGGIQEVKGKAKEVAV